MPGFSTDTPQLEVDGSIPQNIQKDCLERYPLNTFELAAGDGNAAAVISGSEESTPCPYLPSDHSETGSRVWRVGNLKGVSGSNHVTPVRVNTLSASSPSSSSAGSAYGNLGLSDCKDCIAFPMNKAEMTICGMLREFAATCPFGQLPPSVPRVVGGFVRDHLLRRPSLDMDIAVNDITGAQFATAFTKWMASEKHITVSDVAVIRKNPEQSKHLETATTTILGIDVDFVNLRSEKYTCSRIPTVEFGTPREDALRRDFCFNALFYNVVDNCLEDFTGYGMRDLFRGIVRTPVDSLDTLMDDPLRLLRAVRFSSRYGFHMTEKLWKACSNSVAHRLLQEKISRERIGSEIEDIMEHSCVQKAFRMLMGVGVADIVFTSTSSNKKAPQGWQEESLEYIRRLQSLFENPDHLATVFGIPSNVQAESDGKRRRTIDFAAWRHLVKLSGQDPKELLKMLNLGALLYPLIDTVVNDKNESLVTAAVKESLKLPNKLATSITTMCKAAKRWKIRALQRLPQYSTDPLVMQDVVFRFNTNFWERCSAVRDLFRSSSVAVGQEVLFAECLWLPSLVLGAVVTQPHFQGKTEMTTSTSSGTSSPALSPRGTTSDGSSHYTPRRRSSVELVACEAEIPGGIVDDVFVRVHVRSKPIPPEILDRFSVLYEVVKASELENAYKTKPLVDGNKIVEAAKRRAGPWVKDVLMAGRLWQLAHLDGTAASCESWLTAEVIPHLPAMT